MRAKRFRPFKLFLPVLVSLGFLSVSAPGKADFDAWKKTYLPRLQSGKFHYPGASQNWSRIPGGWKHWEAARIEAFRVREENNIRSNWCSFMTRTVCPTRLVKIQCNFVITANGQRQEMKRQCLQYQQNYASGPSQGKPCKLPIKDPFGASCATQPRQGVRCAVAATIPCGSGY